MTKTGGKIERFAALLLGMVLSWLAFEADADAQRWQGRARKIDGVRPEVHLSLGPGFGTGFQLEIPLYQEGWLKGGRATDELALVPGFELYFVDFDDGHCHDGRRHCHGDGDFDPAFGPNLVVMWNVYFNEEWSVFPQFGFTIMFAEDDWVYHHDHQDDYGVFFDPVIGGGARWHFTDRNALVMQLVYPFGFRFGITF